MDVPEAVAWLDRHDIRWVRTDSVGIDGLVIGKHLGRPKFVGALPAGNAIAEIVLGYDIAGAPYLAWWNEWRPDALGDLHQRPDLSTLTVTPDRPDTASVLCEFTDLAGQPVPICPRGLLRRMVAQLAGRGFTAKAAFELEAMVFTESSTEARRRGFTGLTPMSVPAPIGYLHHNSRYQRRFIDEVLLRLEHVGVPVEGWHDEAAPAQIELNFDPDDPISACDHIVRAKQVMREVALEQGCTVTFMAKPSSEYGNGLHVHHSLSAGDAPVFYAADGTMSDTSKRWIAGLMATMPAATSLLCPTINSYRRLIGFAAAPTVASWAEDNKSAAVRVLSRSAKAARIETRVAGGDANPYLVLATVLAGGMAGLDADLPLPEPIRVAGWGLPPHGWPHLPNTITKAADTLRSDALLRPLLGPAFVDYWLNTRRWEWLMFHTTGGDPQQADVTRWELDRYFELA